MDSIFKRFCEMLVGPRRLLAFELKGSLFREMTPGHRFPRATVGTIAEKELLKIPEVASVSRRTGRVELDEHAEGVHYSELEIDFKKGGRSQSVVLTEVREAMTKFFFHGRVVNVGQPISIGSITCCQASTPRWR